MTVYNYNWPNPNGPRSSISLRTHISARTLYLVRPILGCTSDPRPFSFRMAQAIYAGAPLALLAEIDHPSGLAHYWTGVGTLSYNGYSWIGLGTLGGVAPVKQTSEMAIQEVVLSLSGVSPEDRAKLDDDVRNRTATVWLACIGEHGEIVPDPYELVDVLMDFQSFLPTDDGDTVITITTRSGFYSLERALDERWTAEDQKQTYPTDTGLDLISSLQNQDLQWKPS